MSVSDKWDPTDHPHSEKDGKFVHKGTGTFIFGKAKKAVFKKPGSSFDATVDLEPGDELYETPQGNAVKKDIHGNVTLVKPTPPGQPAQQSAILKTGSIAKAIDEGKYTKVEDNKGLEVKAGTVAEAAKLVEQKISDTQKVQNGGPVKKVHTNVPGKPTLEVPETSQVWVSKTKAHVIHATGAWELHSSTGVQTGQHKNLAEKQTDILAKNKSPHWWNEGSPEFEAVQSAAATPDNINVDQGTLTHATGNVLALPPGSTVYQHKASPDSYMVVKHNSAGDLTDATFIGKNGKAVTASQKNLSVLDTNYKVYYSMPGAATPTPKKTAAGATPKAATKATASKKVVASGETEKAITLPSGATFILKPGDVLVDTTTATGGPYTGKYIVARKNLPALYLNDEGVIVGQDAYYDKNLFSSYTSSLQYGDVIAEGPKFKNQPLTDLAPDPKAKPVTSTSQAIKDFGTPLHTVHDDKEYGWKPISKAARNILIANPMFNGSTYMSHPPNFSFEQLKNAVLDKKTRDLYYDMWSSMENSPDYYKGIKQASNKSKWSKTKATLKAHIDMHDFMQAVTDGVIDPNSQEAKDKYYLLTKALESGSFPESKHQYWGNDKAEKFIQNTPAFYNHYLKHLQFNAKMSELGTDLESMGMPDLVALATKEGFQGNPALVSQDFVKKWLQAHFNAPTANSSWKQQVEKAAAKEQAKAVAASIYADILKKNALKDAANAPAIQEQAVIAKAEDAWKDYPLKLTYVHPVTADNHVLTYIGGGVYADLNETTGLSSIVSGDALPEGAVPQTDKTVSSSNIDMDAWTLQLNGKAMQYNVEEPLDLWLNDTSTQILEDSYVVGEWNVSPWTLSVNVQDKATTAVLLNDKLAASALVMDDGHLEPGVAFADKALLQSWHYFAETYQQAGLDSYITPLDPGWGVSNFHNAPEDVRHQLALDINEKFDLRPFMDDPLTPIGMQGNDNLDFAVETFLETMSHGLEKYASHSGWKPKATLSDDEPLKAWELELLGDGTGAVSGDPLDAYKPSTISSDSHWTMAKALLSVEPGSPEQKQLMGQFAEKVPSAAAPYGFNNHGLTKADWDALPLHAKQAAEFATNGYSEGEVVAGLVALFQSGQYYSTPTVEFQGKQFVVPDGYTVWKQGADDSLIFVPSDVDKTMDVQEINNLYPSGINAWSLSTNWNGTITIQNYNSTWVVKLISTSEPLTSGVAKLSVDKANSDLKLHLTEAEWDNIAEIEHQAPDKTLGAVNADHISPDELAYYIKHAGVQITDYPALTAHLKDMPDSVKAAVYYAQATADTDMLKVMDWKYGKGGYAVHYLLQGNADKPYSTYLLHGQTSMLDINDWSPEAVQAYAKDHLKKNEQPTSFNIASSISKSAKDHMQQPDVVKPAQATKLQGELKLTKISKSLGGMHSKEAWSDENGDEWMSKAFASDPNGPARVDAEHYACEIGRLHGFNQPTSTIMTLGGKYSYVQYLAPADGSMQGKDIKNLPAKLIAEAMSEHINDWLVANHDSHSENLLISPDGQKIIGIDKGQAFKFFPDDKLAVGYLPPGNGAPVWYDQFYKGVQNGTISDEVRDEVTKAVLARAHRVATRHDEQTREFFEKALAQRKTFPKKYPTREKFIDALMARKQGIFDDFFDFYKNEVYKGKDFPFAKEDFDVKKVGDAHLTLSAEMMAEVADSGSHGISLMVDSKGVEDSHFLLYTSEASNGTQTLNGHAKLRQDADAALTKWLKSQTVEKGSVQQTAAPTPPALKHKDMQVLPAAFNNLVNFAKTVNSHQEDGGYNTTTVATAKSTMNDLQGYLDKIEQWEKKHPEKPYVGPGLELITHEQQDAWKAQAVQYLSWFKMTEEAMQQKVKIKTLYPNEVPFTAQVYVPSKDVEAAVKAKNLDEVKAAWEGKGTVLYSTNGGGYFSKGVDGTVVKVSQADYDASLAAPGWADALDQFKPSQGSAAPSGSTPAVDKPTWSNADSGSKFVLQDDGDWALMNTVTGEKIDTYTNADMLAQIDEAQQAGDDSWVYSDPSAKETSGTVQSGAKQIKVYHRNAHATAGTFDGATGKLLETGAMTHGQTGMQYDVEFDNVVISYRPWKEPGVQRAQQGQLTFHVKDWNGSSSQIESIMDVLQTMGVEVDQASAESLELYYWRHLYGVMQDRTSHKEAKWQKTINAIQAGFKANPQMSPAEEINMLRSAWAESLGQARVDEIVSTEYYRPRFAKARPLSPDRPVGHPYWLHPDGAAGAQEYRKKTNDATPYHSLTGGSSGSDKIAGIFASGGLASTEERVRILGQWIDGMSSHQDQGKGSSGFQFTRQTTTPHYSNHSFILHPRVIMRSTNYAFSGDNFGEISNRKTQSPFSVGSVPKHANGSGNELQVKHGIPNDDLAGMVVTAAEKAQIIAKLKAMGIDHIGQWTLDEFFVTSGSALASRLTQLWNELEKELVAG